MMQSLERNSSESKEYPLDPLELLSTDEIWLLAYDIFYLTSIFRRKNDIGLSPSIRRKYITTWRMLLKRHKGFMTILKKHDFDPTAIARCDWSEAMKRIGTDRGFFG